MRAIGFPVHHSATLGYFDSTHFTGRTLPQYHNTVANVRRMNAREFHIDRYGVLHKEESGYCQRREPEMSDDNPIAGKLWHSGRWLHVCMSTGTRHTPINVCVAYGIAGNPALNAEH